MVIIGIAGFIGSGKTTTSDWFIQNHGFHRVSFADPIRRMIMALGVSEEVLRDPVKKEEPHPLLLGRTPRYAMEGLGGKWGREYMHPQFWVGHFALAAQKSRFVIVDDVRYPNEVEAIHELKGKVFKLIRPGQEPTVPSDFAVQSVMPDYVIDNDPESGVTQKAIYEFVYDIMFEVATPRPRPGRALPATYGYAGDALPG